MTFIPWMAIILTVGFVIFSWAYQVQQPILYLYCIGMVSFGGLYFHFRYFPPSYRLLEIIIIMSAVGFGWLDSSLLIFIPQLHNYVWGIVVIHVVATSLAIPARFLSAVASQVLVLLGFEYIAFGLSDLAIAAAFFQVLFLNAVAIICFHTAYWREKVLRENFLHQEKNTLYSQALNDELEKGRKIQKDFLPTRIPQIQNCDIATYFHPALQLSGDFYDVFTLPGNRVGLVIADVSDKGVGSALFMALLRSLIRVFSGQTAEHIPYTRTGTPPEKTILRNGMDSSDFDPSAVLNAVSLSNEYIANEHGDEGMFATLFFGILNPSSGTLTYVNGGHEPLFIVGKGGINGRLNTTGPAVGMMPGTQYKTDSIQLEKGDILFGFTDGVTEARSPLDELYTRIRLEKCVQNSPLESATAFLENVKSNLFDFIEQAPQSDDITMLAVRWGNLAASK